MDQSKENEALLKGLAGSVKELVARQDALETIIFKTLRIADAEWNGALRNARSTNPLPSQAAIKKTADVAKFLEGLAKRS
jgi:hypothetical protein